MRGGMLQDGLGNCCLGDFMKDYIPRFARCKVKLTDFIDQNYSYLYVYGAALNRSLPTTY